MAASKVVAIYPNGDLLMEDNWFCDGFNFLTVNTPNFSTSLLKKIKSIRYKITTVYDNDFQRPYEIKQSRITLVDPDLTIKEGDFLYSHSILVQNG